MSGMTPSFYNHEELSGYLRLTLDFLSDILQDIHLLGEFSEGKEFFWNSRISNLTADLSKFVELTTLVSKIIMKKTNQVIPGIKESHIQLLFIVKGMNQARNRKDYLALEELIKYELKDNLTQWKIDLIPKTKKLLGP